MAAIEEITLSDDEIPAIESFVLKGNIFNSPRQSETFPKPRVHEISSSDDESESLAKYVEQIRSPVHEDNTNDGKAFGPTKAKSRKVSSKQNAKVSVSDAKRLKAIQKSEKQLNKMHKPGECMKYITIRLDSSLMGHPNCSNIIDAISNSQIEFQFTKNVANNTVMWTRSELTVNQTDGSLIKTGNIEEEQVLLLMNISDFVIMVKLFKQAETNMGEYRDLNNYIKYLQTQNPAKKFTLVIEGLNAYHRSVRAKKPERKLFKSPIDLSVIESLRGIRAPKDISIFLSREDVDDCLMNMFFETGVSYRIVEDFGELIQVLLQFTKAVAEIPFKKQRDAGTFDWYAEGDRSKPIRVDKSGRGCRNLWLQQLQQFNSVTMDTAFAIASQYPSPTALLEAYEVCNSEKEASLLLQGIPVRRGMGPLTSCRKVGPELSKKIHLFFTSHDGDLALYG